jgi:hypothetical protein
MLDGVPLFSSIGVGLLFDVTKGGRRKISGMRIGVRRREGKKPGHKVVARRLKG